MTIRELFDSAVMQVKDFFSRRENTQTPENEPNLGNGGHSGYRPSSKGDVFSSASMKRKNNGQAAGENGNSAGDPGQAPQQGPAAPENGGYTYGQGGFGAQNAGTQQQASGYSAQPQGAGFNGPQPVQPNFQQQPQAADNISYMPSAGFVDDQNNRYVHCERVVQLAGLNACFRIIEFMRNGESVIINTEVIGDEAEIRRCIDIINGAAFTLGCSMTRISQVRRNYLVAPMTVMVLQDAAVPHWADRDAPQYTAPQQNWQMPYRQQTYEQQPMPQANWGGYQTAAQSGYEPQPEPNTAWQEPSPGERYSSDTRQGVYSAGMPQMGYEGTGYYGGGAQ